MSAAVGALVATWGLQFAGPATAATTPTFDVPPIGTGFGDIVLTGTAAPNVDVTLHERAYIFGKDVVDPAGLEAAEQYFTDKPTTVRSNSSGRWAITRTMDSGFVFSVEAEDLYSRIVKAPLRASASEFTATPGAAGTVNFVVRASPDQPGIPVSIQRYTSTGWTQVANGVTDGTSDADDRAELVTSVSGQPAGTHYYRAFLSEGTSGYASADNLLLANYSSNVAATVAGSSPAAGPVPAANVAPAVPEGATSGPVTTTPPTTKPPTTTPPTTKPPTTKPPTTPTAPAAGSVQFTRVQYNAPGADSKKNASINGEYARLTNKTKKTINLNGWTVRDAAGNSYRFPSLNLGAGKTLTLRSGKGTNTSTTRYWARTKHIWNNGGDTATLRTPTKTIDTCRWTNPAKGYTTC
ncbi:lamin tail domain-containing protein [Actinoplanes sp. NPDC024001]|uniref:lamin tail domain-containing protein n=1 Tax=Actinoplanes sp. NPDC024001 TaxID=3154598 RepID=UPI0034000D7A